VLPALATRAAAGISAYRALPRHASNPSTVVSEPSAHTVLSYADRLGDHLDDYLAAVLDHPAVRDREFAELKAYARLDTARVLLEFPTEGRMLDRHFPAARVERADLLQPSQRRLGSYASDVMLTDWSLRGLLARRYDAVLCVVPIHHASAQEKRQFAAGCARVLTAGGVLCFGEVEQGSQEMQFLDGFVDRHTPTGHCGEYPTASFAEVMRDAGFEQVTTEVRRCPWRFSSTTAMHAYLSQLFALRPIPEAELVAAVRAGPGLRVLSDGVELGWSLRYFRGTRASR